MVVNYLVQRDCSICNRNFQGVCAFVDCSKNSLNELVQVSKLIAQLFQECLYCHDCDNALIERFSKLLSMENN